ncbi:hypothetical protein JCM19039_1450 [Geomicrobium sp. JCM 19039]|nr:hypothetical protein JCM19039_1450 [Geomicrobium sp. JCM 19039]
MQHRWSKIAHRVFYVLPQHARFTFLPTGYGVWKEVQMPHIFINVTLEKEKSSF